MDIDTDIKIHLGCIEQWANWAYTAYSDNCDIDMTIDMLKRIINEATDIKDKLTKEK